MPILQELKFIGRFYFFQYLCHALWSSRKYRFLKSFLCFLCHTSFICRTLRNILSRICLWGLLCKAFLLKLLYWVISHSKLIFVKKLVPIHKILNVRQIRPLFFLSFRILTCTLVPSPKKLTHPSWFIPHQCTHHKS